MAGVSAGDSSFDDHREAWKRIYTHDIPKELKARLEYLIEGATPQAKESLRNVMVIEYQYEGLEGAIAYLERLERNRFGNVHSTPKSKHWG
jgi:hypothetical protein